MCPTKETLLPLFHLEKDSSLTPLHMTRTDGEEIDDVSCIMALTEFDACRYLFYANYNRY